MGTQHKSLTKISLYIHIGNCIQSTAWTEVTDKKNLKLLYEYFFMNHIKIYFHNNILQLLE